MSVNGLRSGLASDAGMPGPVKEVSAKDSFVTK